MHIGIIGGGASGMMAAVFASKQGAQVTILEHTQRVGRKILSTGNGKCNFTNRELSKDDYYADHPSFVEEALSKFDADCAVDFFERSGMTVVSKRDGYYYPHSGQASTVLNVLRLLLSGNHVEFKTEQEILSAAKKVNRTGNEQFFVKTKEAVYHFDKLILACGGNAAPATGSDGSGYKLAKAFGHSVKKPLPVLTFLYSREKLLKELAGVRVGAEISLWTDDKLSQREEGELQLNKDNLSGIPVFQLSHRAIKALDEKKKVALTVDFLPGYEEEDVTDRLNQLVFLYKEIPVSEALCTMLHKKVCGAILHKTAIPFDKKMGELSRKELHKIIGYCRAFPFELTGFPAFPAAQATMGGVDIKEVDENMMSRKVEGLYFAGEIMDVDGRCGGYNLQWAWTSGYIAGCHSATGEVKCYK